MTIAEQDHRRLIEDLQDEQIEARREKEADRRHKTEEQKGDLRVLAAEAGHRELHLRGIGAKPVARLKRSTIWRM